MTSDEMVIRPGTAVVPFALIGLERQWALTLDSLQALSLATKTGDRNCQ